MIPDLDRDHLAGRKCFESADKFDRTLFDPTERTDDIAVSIENRDAICILAPCFFPCIQQRIVARRCLRNRPLALILHARF